MACGTTFLLKIPSTLARIFCGVAVILLWVVYLAFSAQATSSELLLVLANSLIAVPPAVHIGWVLSQRLFPAASVSSSPAS
jgi:hypothetical protein